MDLLLAINWNVDPEIFGLGKLSIRWYGLTWALSFILGQYVITKFYLIDGRTEKEVDNLAIYIILGSILGARIGHCLFYGYDAALGYNPYLRNPLDILKIWEGGLASHGGGFGVFLAMWLYVRKTQGISFLWLADRVSVITLLSGALIRFGNLMNSEIVGKATDLPWGFNFLQLNENPVITRHPAQLYESLTCVIMFVILMWAYYKTDIKQFEGRMFGIFLIWVFALRFCYEFLKENQADFESSLTLNMGQILSIPMVLAGVFLLVNSFRKRA